jgi:hypothetical protein
MGLKVSNPPAHPQHATGESPRWMWFCKSGKEGVINAGNDAHDT